MVEKAKNIPLKMVRHKVWLKMSVKAAIIQRKHQKTWGSITQDQKDYNKV